METHKEFTFLKGIPFISRFYDMKAIERIRDEFDVHDRDVFLVTYPKSGTHWMVNILSLIYSKGDPTWIKYVPCWSCSPWIDIKKNMEIIKNRTEPRLLTSHLPIQLFPKSYFTSKAKMIYVARNPRDVIVSNYHFQKHLLSHPVKHFEHFLEDFMHGNVHYGSWFDHIKGWLSMRDSENFLCLTYEELHQDLKASVEKLCQFLGKEMSEEEIGSVQENVSSKVMKKHILENKNCIEVEYRDIVQEVMRKEICGDWKNHFTVAQMETFNKLYQEKMKELDHSLFAWDQC